MILCIQTPETETASRNVKLVGSSNPFQKYARQTESSPQLPVKITSVWNHHLQSGPLPVTSRLITP